MSAEADSLGCVGGGGEGGGVLPGMSTIYGTFYTKMGLVDFIL